MIQYLLECIAFQFVFLCIYELFLKSGTFFQWNRIYLIGTYIFSMALPLIKIEAMKINGPEVLTGYPEFLWNRNDAMTIMASELEIGFRIIPEHIILFGGMFLAVTIFAYKLRYIFLLKRKGKVDYFKDFVRIIVPNSSIAFSFLRSIFLGDQIRKEEYRHVVEHEMVHINQGHSYDLIFFELMRIIGWFNPLVYVYQNRISELHEFMADAYVKKTSKTEQYQFLLSQVFQTQNISFINQFFKDSLIKKRIVMLTKKRSKQVFKLNYLLLIPAVLLMLFYSSCGQEVLENENSSIEEVKSTSRNSSVPFAIVEQVPVFPECEDAADSRTCFKMMMQKHISKNFRYPQEAQELGIEGRVSTLFTISMDGYVKNIKTRGPDTLLEDEVKRIIERLPQMKPGKQDGKTVDVPFSIPIMFKLKQGDFDNLSNRKDVEVSESITRDLFDEAYEGIVPFSRVDEAPVFPECNSETDKKSCFQKAIINHIKKNFQYPEEAESKDVQGRVAVLFVISKSGTVKGIKTRGPDKLLENEAERIISKLPKMIPAKHQGKVSEVVFSIPISFRLN